jgi:hypothetical protein
MTIETPSRGGDRLPDDEQKQLTVLSHKPRATFQWPLDCLWPFVDRAPEMDHLRRVGPSRIELRGRNRAKSACA